MKMKITLMAALMLSAFVLKTKAQTIPNAGFESWTSFGTYSEPTGWTSFNSLGFGAYTTEQGAPGFAGASYLKLTVKDDGFGGLVPALALSNPTYPMSSLGGFPYTSRPAFLTGKWQYKSTGVDTLFAYAAVSKWNSATSTSDPIGVGYSFLVGATVSSWTSFSIPLTYVDSSNPDTAVIYFIAGGGSTAVLNDYLYVDELAFSGIVPSGIDELSDAIEMTLAPNPFSANTKVTFKEEQENVNLTVVNLLGEVVRSFTFSGTELLLEKGELPAGVYFLNVSDNNLSSTKKIMIE